MFNINQHKFKTLNTYICDFFIIQKHISITVKLEQILDKFIVPYPLNKLDYFW